MSSSLQQCRVRPVDHPAARPVPTRSWRSTYRLLATACWVGNALGAVALTSTAEPGAAAALSRTDPGSVLAGTALASTALHASLVNLAVAVLIRDQRVMNLLYHAIGSIGGVPLVRGRRWSAVHQVGGVHLGAATAGVAWFLASTAAGLADPVRPLASVTAGLQLTIVGVSLVVCAGAAPWVRERHHDLFELSHRAGGWLCLLLLWALTVVAFVGTAGTPVWPLVVLAVITASVAAPWIRLRRVPVAVRVLSDHAVMLTVSDGVRPEVGATIAVSRHAWGQWHSFATITLPGQSGYSLLVSRAGDWTGRLIDDPPDHLWVRGMPLTSFARLEHMYARVVVVVTGSGIGPFLGQLLAGRVPARLVWATREPRATYGDDLVDALLRAQPEALVWDTTDRGRPDLPRLAAEVARSFGAEAVFVTSNRSTTAATVNRLQAEGFCAYGPIWDS